MQDVEVPDLNQHKLIEKYELLNTQTNNDPCGTVVSIYRWIEINVLFAILNVSTAGLKHVQF